MEVGAGNLKAATLLLSCYLSCGLCYKKAYTWKSGIVTVTAKRYHATAFITCNHTLASFLR
jgi:hypothetical protein